MITICIDGDIHFLVKLHPRNIAEKEQDLFSCMLYKAHRTLPGKLHNDHPQSQDKKP